MINDELKIFVKNSLDKGDSKEKISAELLANGWNQNDLDEVFNPIPNNGDNPVFVVPKYSSKDLAGLSKYMVFLAILLLVMGGGFTAYKLGYLNSVLPASEIKLAEEPLTTAQSAEDPNKDWKTYANTEYGFEFKYPAEWKYELKDKGLVFNPYTPTCEACDEPGASGHMWFSKSFSELMSWQPQMFAQDFASYVKIIFPYETTVKVFNNISWTCGEGEEVSYNVSCITQSSTGEIVYISLYINDNFGTIDTILSTFKFTH